MTAATEPRATSSQTTRAHESLHIIARRMARDPAELRPANLLRHRFATGEAMPDVRLAACLGAVRVPERPARPAETRPMARAIDSRPTPSRLPSPAAQ